MPETIGLERFYIPLVQIKLNDSEWKNLEIILDIEIPDKFRDVIEHALEHLVAFYCFKHRVPSLNELKSRLREIRNTSQRLLILCEADPVDFIGKQKKKRKPIPRGIARHVLSASQIVNRYLLYTAPAEARSLQKYLIPVRTLVEICERGLHQLEKRASKPGAKRDTGLSYAVRVLVFVACKTTRRADHELPSPETKKYNQADFPLLIFIRTAISMGAEKGIQALKNSDAVEPLEKEAATKLLKSLIDLNQHKIILNIASAAVATAQRMHV